MLSSHGVLSQLHFLVCWSVLNTNLVSFTYTVKWWAIFQSALWQLKSLKPLSIEKNLWTLNPPFKLVGKYLLQPLWTRENMKDQCELPSLGRHMHRRHIPGCLLWYGFEEQWNRPKCQWTHGADYSTKMWSVHTMLVKNEWIKCMCISSQHRILEEKVQVSGGPIK